MPQITNKRQVRHAAADMFDLVADVERYPQFLPWCLACRIVRRPAPNVFVADIMIGFKMFRERFTSEVTLRNPHSIDVVYDRGPFRYLTNHWRFEADSRGMCAIDFYIDFEFRSRALQALIGRLFNEAVQRMVSAFQRRAAQLYRAAPKRSYSESQPEVAASGEPPRQ